MLFNKTFSMLIHNPDWTCWKSSKYVWSYTIIFAGDPESNATEIKWKDGMDLTKRAQQQASRKRRRGNGRTFFTWFNDVSDPSADDIAEVCRRSRLKNRVKFKIYIKIGFQVCVVYFMCNGLNSKGFVNRFLFSDFSLV